MPPKNQARLLPGKHRHRSSGRPSAGRRADFGALSGSSPAKIRPGRPISGPEALLRKGKATLVMRRLAAISLEDAAANPRSKRKGRPKGQPEGTAEQAPGEPLPPAAALDPGGHEVAPDTGLGWLLDSGDEAQAGQHFGEEDNEAEAFLAFFCSDEATVAPEPPLGPVQETENHLLPVRERVPVPVLAAPALGSNAFLCWVVALDGPLPLHVFDSQAQWHLMTAFRSLVASGQRFNVPGTGFDLLLKAKAKAPQCTNCFRHFAVSKVQSIAKLGSDCTAVGCVLDPPAVAPQRLVPKRSYPIGGAVLHDSHQLGHFAGRVWCEICACTFGVCGPRVPPSLLKPCSGHTSEDTAKRNLACLAKGELPAAWRAGGWPLGPEAGLLGFVGCGGM